MSLDQYACPMGWNGEPVSASLSNPGEHHRIASAAHVLGPERLPGNLFGCSPQAPGVSLLTLILSWTIVSRCATGNDHWHKSSQEPINDGFVSISPLNVTTLRLITTYRVPFLQFVRTLIVPCDRDSYSGWMEPPLFVPKCLLAMAFYLSVLDYW